LNYQQIEKYTTMKGCNSNKSNDAKPEHVPDTVRSSEYGSFKKKGGNNNKLNSESNSFKGLVSI